MLEALMVFVASVTSLSFRMLNALAEALFNKSCAEHVCVPIDLAGDKENLPRKGLDVAVSRTLTDVTEHCLGVPGQCSAVNRS